MRKILKKFPLLIKAPKWVVLLCCVYATYAVMEQESRDVCTVSISIHATYIGIAVSCGGIPGLHDVAYMQHRFRHCSSQTN